MKKSFIVAFALLLSFVGTACAQSSTFRAASCADLCDIVLGANTTGNVLSAKYHYKLVNNYSQGSGFVTLYSQATVVNVNTSEVIRLEREGVSNIVLCNNYPGYAVTIGNTFFSQANANKFIEQMKEYGFRKTTEKEEGWPVWRGPHGLRILEETARQGRFNYFIFFIKDELAP